MTLPLLCGAGILLALAIVPLMIFIDSFDPSRWHDKR
jgi:hypothetical protein